MVMKTQSIRTQVSAVLLLWAVCATAAAADVQAARALLAGQNYSGAISELNTVLKTHPGDAEARFLKGLALARSGDTSAALDLFEALTADHPEMAEAWNNLGVLRARSGNLAGAREALQKAAALDPQHAPAQENLGDIYVALARQAYLNASELEPDNRVASVKSRQLADLMDQGVAAAAEPGPAPAAKPATSASVIASAGAGAQADVQAPMSDPLPLASEAASGNDAATKRGATETVEAVRAALQDWARAWSTQNLEGYFDAYSDDFDPAGERSVTEWTRLRNNRLTAPETIEVKLSDIDVILTSPDSAVVRFDQRYRSNLYQDRERKTVTMVHGAEGWVITSES